MDGGHAWEGPVVAEDKASIIYEDLFSNHEVFCMNPHQNFRDK
jgi:hypothetical protein